MDPTIPFNQLPDLPPAADLETRAILKKTITANRELAELKGVGPLIPRQSILVQTLGLQEAKYSSEIENIVTTNDELYRASAEASTKADPSAKEVLRYQDALWFGYNEIQDSKRLLTTPLFEKIVARIAGNNAGIRNLPGTKIINPFGETVYCPPEGETLLRNKLDNLNAYFYAETEIDPIVRMAVGHYQFEALQPFYDGNGRTGRILNVLFLVAQNLLDQPILYLSRYIIEHKALYYQLLRDVTVRGGWEQWVIFMLDAVIESSILARRRILAINELMSSTSDKIKNELPRVYSKDLVEVLFQNPYCKIKFIEQAGIAKRQTASTYLQQLESIGILHCALIGRDKYYLNPRFMQLLSA